MSLNNLQMAINAVLNGKGTILNWYSPRELRKSQLIKLHTNGINATCRKRSKAWFEIDFRKI